VRPNNHPHGRIGRSFNHRCLLLRQLIPRIHRQACLLKMLSKKQRFSG
jgi:hypothetical protein